MFEIDVMLRIHLRALIDPDEEIDMESEEYRLQVQKYEQLYDFPRYYQRNSSHRYVRLADIAKNLSSYIQYCLDLDKAEKFYCCQLKQALGILNNDKIAVLMSTDSGVCYNLLDNYSAIFETIYEGETDYLQANTFYGKVINQDRIQIVYNPDTGNIDPDDSENVVYFLSKGDVENRLNETVKPVSTAFLYLNHHLSEQLKNKESLAILNEVFPVDLQDRVYSLLERYSSPKN